MTTLAVAAFFLSGVAATRGEAQEGDRPPVPTVGPRDLVLDGDPVRVILPPGRIPAIDSPRLIPADAADLVYRDEEPVMGLVVGGEARAYSLWHLDRHEIVNDEVGGRAIAATW